MTAAQVVSLDSRRMFWDVTLTISAIIRRTGRRETFEALAREAGLTWAEAEGMAYSAFCAAVAAKRRA